MKGWELEKKDAADLTDRQIEQLTRWAIFKYSAVAVSAAVGWGVFVKLFAMI